MSSPERQRGVALLTVLLVVAMASILAVTMLKAQQSLLQRSASVFTQDQAYLYTLGAETLARTVLQEDRDKDQQNGEAQDTLGEDWARSSADDDVLSEGARGNNMHIRLLHECCHKSAEERVRVRCG